MIWFGSGLSIIGAVAALVSWLGFQNIPIIIGGVVLALIGLIIIFNSTKYLNGRTGGWLSSPNLLAKKPQIGWIPFLIGMFIFGLMAANLVFNGPLLTVDTSIANALHNAALHTSPGMLNFIESGFFIGKELVIITGILMGVYYVIRRYWKEFWMVVVGKVGGLLIFEGLSLYVFHRDRPAFEVPITKVLTFPGFPSGHAIATVTTYGLIAYLLLPTISSRFAKWVVISITLFVILFVGFSRIFVGGHYLTDVIAGYGLGLAWAGISYMAIESYFVHRNKRRIENEELSGKS
jgi:undecaprenyl-diphosphatase